jgi:hypothetical protein
MVTVVFGSSRRGPDSEFYLETDLAHPVVGPIGLIGLYRSSQLLESYYIGFTSPKHNISKFLRAVESCISTYRRLYSHSSLTVHCHAWKSGIGKTLLIDILKISQPRLILEYYTEAPALRNILVEKTSFLTGIYALPTNIEMKEEKVDSENISDIKIYRQRNLERYFGGSFPDSLINMRPHLAFFSDLVIMHNGVEMESEHISALIGKLCGLSVKGSMPECRGIGLIRDVNSKAGLISIITPINLTQEIEVIEITSGENCLDLWRDSIWTLNIQSDFEENVPYIVSGAIMSEGLHKYHPGRKYLS